MKISLISSVLATTLLCGSVFAQTNRPKRNQTNQQKKTVAPKKNVTQKKTTAPKKAEEKKTVVSAVAVDTKKEDVSKTSFDKFRERLGITYVGFFTSAPLGQWDGRHAAISPQWEEDVCDNCDTYPVNLYNQFNISYNFGAKMKFNIIPRFSLFFGEARNQKPGERSTFLMEDWLVGFSGTIFSSADKKFNWWMRPGVRLPTSHFARHYADNADFGQYNYQLDWLQTFSYQLNDNVELGVTIQERVYIYENRYNWSRHRHLTNPYITLKLSDTDALSFHYENIVENTRRWKSINGKEPKYMDVWQNAYVSWSKQVTPKLSVSPAVNAFVDDAPFSLTSFWFSTAVAYSF